MLSVGLLCSALAFGLGSGLLVIGGYIAFCGILCLIMKKHAGVTIGWITLAQAVILTPFFTGVRVFAVFSPSYYSRGISVNHIITIGIWILFFVLAGLSFRAIGGRKKNKCAQEKENRCNPSEKDV